MTKKGSLKVVTTRPQSYRDPPRNVGAPGQQLWNSIMSQFDIHDAAGVEMLTQACEMLSRAEAFRIQIEDEGAMIKTSTGTKAHPLLTAELNARNFVVRTLRQLGLDVQPLQQREGRPSRPLGWQA
jgi:terminase small subunit-like protein